MRSAYSVRMTESLFPELSYANGNQPALMRWVIRTIENLSGRDRVAGLYRTWRESVAPSGERVFGRMLDLLDLRLATPDQWPPSPLPEGPLVMIANHPYGIGDGIAILSLAEQLGRPFRVMIASDLLKVPEMRAYALPVDFSETREAVQNNMAMRHEALALLRAGVVIVVFPAGGVATAPKGFGPAKDLPWKVFPARLVQDAKANVIPIHFSGQNGLLFHLVSRPMSWLERPGRVTRAIGRASLTLRLSLLVREFTRLRGRAIDVRIGRTISWQELEGYRDRKALLDRLQQSVTGLEARRNAPQQRAPSTATAWLDLGR